MHLEGKEQTVECDRSQVEGLTKIIDEIMVELCIIDSLVVLPTSLPHLMLRNTYAHVRKF